MTTTKRILSVLLTLILFMSIVPMGQAELTTKETYDEHLELLNLYMQGGGAENGVSIDVLEDVFFSLNNYNQSMGFWMYCSVLQFLNNGDYDNAISFIHIMQSANYEGFRNLLKDDPSFREEYSSICSVEELELYVQGRKAEHDGNNSLAESYYSQCMGCMDARDRFLAIRPNLNDVYNEALVLIQKGDYAAAREKAQYLLDNGFDGAKDLMVVIDARLAAQSNANAATPVPAAAAATATPKPAPQYSYTSFTANAAASGTKVTLSWPNVRDATHYRVYHAVTKNGNRDFQQITTTSTPSFTHTETSQGVNNYYQVEAVAADGTIVGNCSEVKVYVEAKKQWGSWSGWSTTPVSATSTREVQTKTETEDTYVTKYQYTRWHYYTTKGVWYNSPVEFYNSSIYSSKKEATWQSKTTDTPLSRDGSDPTFGKPMYEGYWFNQTTKQVKSGTKQVTYYRYRELK